MSAVEYYPSAFPAFNLTSSTTSAAAAAAAAAAADRMRSDFQTSLRRNLRNWAEWRIQLNGNLASAVMTGCQMTDVEPIESHLDRAAPHPGHPTNNPKTLLTFSADANSSTPLPHDEFFKYGIPRARVDPQLQQLHQRRLEALDSHSLSHSAPNLGDGRRHQAGNAAVLCNRRFVAEPEDHLPDEDDDDEELVLDYFNFDDTPSSSTDRLGARRRFHRSAATLPTVPSWADSDVDETDCYKADGRRRPSATAPMKKATDRRRQIGQLQQQQKQQQVPKLTTIPPFAAPFSRQRIITARRDDVMYASHNAWRVDEL